MKAANEERVSGSANKVDEQSRAAIVRKGSSIESVISRDNRCMRKHFLELHRFHHLLAPLSPQDISMPSRVELRAKPASKIRVERNGNIVRKIVPFQFDRLYPLSSVKITDDEALNEGKNTIDDSRASCRHYYYLSASLIESCSFLSRWNVTHLAMIDCVGYGADTFYRDLSGSRGTVLQFQFELTPRNDSSILRI